MLSTPQTQTATDTESTTLPARPTSRIHLAYLDGLRGLAAVYIVLHHARSMLFGLPSKVDLGLSVVRLGRFSVTIFIVLSGYCLMLPVISSATQQLKGGMIDYIRRRARRILPPYYSALALCLLLIALRPSIHLQNTQVLPAVVNDFSLMAIGSHLLVIHNLALAWAESINPAMWSVATEWQIYFLFPLLLLPLWRRFGIGVPILSGFVLGLLPFYLLGMSDGISPWFLGVFALGMAGAVINFSQQPRMVALRTRLPWHVIAVVFFALFLVLALGTRVAGLEDMMREDYRWILDTVIGIATTALIINCTNFRLTHGDDHSAAPIVLRVLESRPAVTLGVFSYSLYLIHYPLLEFAHAFANDLHLGPVTELLVMSLVVIPIIVVLAYLFHLVFERPFMKNKSSRG